MRGEEFGVFAGGGMDLATSMREGGNKTLGRRRGIYRVKISFVTAAMLYLSRRARQSLSIRAVFPEPTGLFAGFWLAPSLDLACTRGAYPPMPTVYARSVQSLPSMSGSSREV